MEINLINKNNKLEQKKAEAWSIVALSAIIIHSVLYSQGKLLALNDRWTEAKLALSLSLSLSLSLFVQYHQKLWYE